MNSLNGEIDFDLGNTDSWSIGDDVGDEATGGDLASIEEDNESHSNSKVDALLDDMLELFVRDYIMSWLWWMIWDKEKDKFAAQAKY